MENNLNFSAILEKMQETETEVKQMLNPLLERGWLTQLDEKTIFLEVISSKEAILKAIQNPGYDPTIQSELIYRLLERYQEAIFRIARDAVNRQYTDERITARLNDVNYQYNDEIKMMAGRDLLSERDQREINRSFQREYNKLIDAIKRMPKNHPKRGETIELWIKDYEKTLSAAIHSFNPNLDSPLKLIVTKVNDVLEGKYRDIPYNENNIPNDKKKKD